MSVAPRVPIVEPGIDWVDGVPVVRNKGAYSNLIATTLAGFLGVFVNRQDRGVLLGSRAGYQYPALRRGEVTFTDFTYVRRNRLAAGRVPVAWMTIPPDLVFEAVSPDDIAEEVLLRNQEWLASGAKLAWIVYPKARKVSVLRANGTGLLLGEEDFLDGEDVVPGFWIRVRDIFPAARRRAAPAD